MQQIQFISALGDRVVASHSSQGVFLQSIGGLTEADIEPIATSGFGQLGQSYARSIMGAREIPIELYVHAQTASELYALRRQLSRIFNPLAGIGTLIYSNNSLTVSIPAYVSSPLEERESEGTLRLYKLELTAPNPLWRDLDERVAYLSDISGGLRFPMRLPAKYGTTGAVANITIDGDYPSPVRIEIRGGTVNPIIANQSSGELISVPITVPTGTMLTIRTGYGEKAVQLTDAAGTVTDAFDQIDPASTFFTLKPGRNRLVFTSDDVNTADVAVYWRNWYTGV